MPVPYYLDKARGERWNPKKDTTYALHTWNNAPNPYDHSSVVEFDSASKAETRLFLRDNLDKIRKGSVSATKPSSWMDSIDYSKGYDPKIEDRFRNENNYLGLADYLSKFRMDDLQKQREYEREISQLRRYGRQYNAIHGHASDEQSNSISFLEAFNNGDVDALDNNNPVKEQYNNAISALGKTVNYTGLFGEYSEGGAQTGKEEAATISVKFNNKHVSYSLWGFGPDVLSKDVDENQFDKFAKETGYNQGEIRNLLGDNAITRDKDGKVIVNIPKSNPVAIKFLTEVRAWCNENGRNTDDVSYTSYGADNNLINSDSVVIGHQIQNLSNLLSEVGKNKDDVINRIGGEAQTNSTTILPYMNERQMQLKQLVNAGAIDDSKYTAMMKADNEIYENLLLGTAFSQLDIYTDMDNKGGDETLYQMDNNIRRGELKDYIRSAIDENRVSWRAAISGGKYGTYLVVTPKRDKGNIDFDDEDARRGATIFIPGLFTKSIQNAFDASTQGKTVAEFNSMQQYGYEYTLQNGDVLSSVGNTTAKLFDKNLGGYRIISREQAQDLLHQSITVEDASMAIRNRMFNLDGTLRQGYNYENAAKVIAVEAANESYPGGRITPDEVWFSSKDEEDKVNAAGNLDKDYKAKQARIIYRQIMNNIFKLLNKTK